MTPSTAGKFMKAPFSNSKSGLKRPTRVTLFATMFKACQSDSSSKWNVNTAHTSGVTKLHTQLWIEDTRVCAKTLKYQQQQTKRQKLDAYDKRKSNKRSHLPPLFQSCIQCCIQCSKFTDITPLQVDLTASTSGQCTSLFHIIYGNQICQSIFHSNQ